MKSPKLKETKWYPEKRLVVTQLSGHINEEDILQWERNLIDTLDSLENNTVFKILVDVLGFLPVSIEAHKKYRLIIPLTLAAYGWQVGYMTMFKEETDHLKMNNIRGIKCIGAAHVHHDKNKMAMYAEMYGREHENFFSDPEQARQWIEQLEIAV